MGANASAPLHRLAPPLALGGLTLLACASLLFALSQGSVTITLDQLWQGLTRADSPTALLLTELRLPRALSAFAVGGLLALAGALMQALLRNPLADPYVLGVSGGAAVGALLAILLGAGSLWIGGGSFIGALGSMLLVFTLAHGRGSWTPTRLLLTGIVIASGWGALINFILAISPDDSLRGMLFWLMGDLSHIPAPTTALVVLLVALLLCLPLGRSLTLLGRGEAQAQALGVAVTPLRLAIYVIASLITAVAVTTAGSVGFVGLVVPHLVRLALGNDQRILLPASILLGGSLLVCADTLARTLIAPPATAGGGVDGRLVVA